MGDHDPPEVEDKLISDDSWRNAPSDNHPVYGVVEHSPEELRRLRKHDRWYARWRRQKCEEKDEGSWYNTRKRSSEYADEVLDKAIAYALNKSSKKSKSGHAWYPSCDALVCQHVKAQLMHDECCEFKDEGKRTDYMEKIAGAHEELARAVEGVDNELCRIASELEGR